MKTRIYPVNENMNIFDNKENINPLLNYTPKQIMVDGTNIDSVYNSMKINFDRWRSDYPEINE